MRGRAAISVDDDLAAGQSGVAVGAADDEAPGWVDVIDGFVAEQFGGQDIGDDALHIGVKLGLLVALVIAHAMLGRDDDRGRRGGLAVVEAQGDLALGVGLKEGRRARVAVGGHPLQDLVAVVKRRRHQIGGLVAGEAEHDALVAGTFVLVAGRVDALRDVRRLAVEIIVEIGGLPVEAFLLVADPLDDAADDRSISSRAPGAQPCVSLNCSSS